MLFSLVTPGPTELYQLDTNAERTCIDIGASACISTQKDNFVSLKETNNMKINGIESGLQVSGIGTLKWSIYDAKNNEIDLFVKDALYVPTASMGLICPQQIAQQA